MRIMTLGSLKMGLEKVFGKAEKVEEKVLEVVASDESMVDDFLDYFDKTKDIYSVKENFDIFQQDLQDRQINPSLVSKINLILQQRTRIQYGYFRENLYNSLKGLFLSALIQTSYNQGFNGFEFEEINAECFGAFLEGREDNKIRIKIEKIEGSWNFVKATAFSASIQTLKGSGNFQYSKNFSTQIGMLKGGTDFLGATSISATINQLEANYGFYYAKKSIIKINNYQGNNFGYEMENCKVYSPNETVIKQIKEESCRYLNSRGNKFLKKE
ncbi:hypothetical protein HY643_04130 [Candidatus Woesearchaeota archaeon]|nr:hypothetical protein [Candidatus Woesearchaeota archaeon]